MPSRSGTGVLTWVAEGPRIIPHDFRAGPERVPVGLFETMLARYAACGPFWDRTGR